MLESENCSFHTNNPLSTRTISVSHVLQSTSIYLEALWLKGFSEMATSYSHLWLKEHILLCHSNCYPFPRKPLKHPYHKATTKAKGIENEIFIWSTHVSSWKLNCFVLETGRMTSRGWIFYVIVLWSLVLFNLRHAL
jgi:hypothetical protein